MDTLNNSVTLWPLMNKMFAVHWDIQNNLVTLWPLGNKMFAGYLNMSTISNVIKITCIANVQ